MYWLDVSSPHPASPSFRRSSLFICSGELCTHKPYIHTHKNHTEIDSDKKKRSERKDIIRKTSSVFNFFVCVGVAFFGVFFLLDQAQLNGYY